MRAVALVAAAVTALAAGVTPALAAAPVSVSTSVSDRFLYFADTITARVTVLADRRQVDPASIRFNRYRGVRRLGPGRAHANDVDLGRAFTRRSWSFDIACLQSTCLPNGKPLAVQLPPVTVSAKRLDGSTVAVRQGWRAVEIAPRFGPAPRGAIPVFGLNHELPGATYRI